MFYWGTLLIYQLPCDNSSVLVATLLRRRTEIVSQNCALSLATLRSQDTSQWNCYPPSGQWQVQVDNIEFSLYVRSFFGETSFLSCCWRSKILSVGSQVAQASSVETHRTTTRRNRVRSARGAGKHQKIQHSNRVSRFYSQNTSRIYFSSKTVAFPYKPL